MGLFKKIGKKLKQETKSLTKKGILDPLGLFQGADKRQQRFRKVARIGTGAAGGFIKGGIPGAIAGGTLAGVQASRKQQGRVPFTLGRALKDFGGGYLAGMGTNAVVSKFAAPAMAKTVAVNAGGSGTAGVGGLMSKSAPNLVNTAAPAASNWSNILSARDITTPLIAGQIQNTLGLNQPQPMPDQGQMPEQDRVNAIYNDYLMAQENRRKRMFTPI